MMNKTTNNRGRTNAQPRSFDPVKLLRFSLFTMLLMLCGGSMWADDVTLASGTFNKTTYTEGWTTTGTGIKTSNCVIIGSGENITSPSLNLSQYSKVTISIKARRYGTLTGSKATIDASIGGNSVGTTVASGTNATTALTDIEFTPTESMTAATIVFTCTNATSPGSTHGAGINSIVITGTTASSGDLTATTVTLTEGYATSGFVGSTLDLPSYTVKAGDTSIDATVVWTSSDETIATISDGKINLLKAGTTTIKASYAGDDTYKPSDKSFTLTVNEAPITTASALNAAAIEGGKNGKTVTYNFTNTKVVYVNGSYNYIADETGYALLYKSNLGLTAGKVITGTLTGTAKTYSGLPEIAVTSIDVTSSADDTDVPAPTTITIDELANNVNNYIKVENAEYVSADGKKLSFIIGETNLTVYNQFGLSTTGLTAGKIYNITGFGSINNSTNQIYPTEITEAVAPTPDPLYILGVNDVDKDGNWDIPSEFVAMNWDAEKEVYTYELTNTSTASFCFSTNNEVSDWDTFNSTYRWATGEGNLEIPLNWVGMPLTLQKANGTIKLPAGTWTISIAPNDTPGEMGMTITGEATPVETNYYIIGSMTNWAVDENYKMTAVDGADTEEYQFTMDLTTSSEFKVVTVDGETKIWYPDGSDNNYGQNGEISADGNYTIYFRPKYDGGEDWFYNVIYVAANEPAEVTYIVAGSEAEIFGTSWDETNEANKMTKQTDGTYQKTYTVNQAYNNVQLKVVKDNDKWYGDADDKNIIFNLTGAGNFTVSIDPTTSKITVTGDIVQFATTLEYTTVYAVGNGEGNWLNGAAWDPGYTANEMKKVKEDVWEITFKDVPDGFERQIKFAIDGAWTHNFGGSFSEFGKATDAVYNGDNITFDTEEDLQDITVRLDLTGFNLATQQGAKFTIFNGPFEEPATGFRDIKINLMEHSELLTESNVYITVAEDGTIGTTDDATKAAGTIKGKAHSSYGSSNFTASIPVEGCVKITYATHDYGNDIIVTNEAGAEVAKLNTKGDKWMNNHDKVVVAYYRTNEPTTLHFSNANYNPYFAVEAIAEADLPAEVTTYNVTFTAEGAEGVVPAAIEVEAGGKFAIPANYTLYKEGYTLTGWSDGTNNYAAGAEVTPDADMALTAVFTENTVSLADREEAVTVTYTLNGSKAQYGFQSGNGIIVTQATIGENVIDVKAATSGKFAYNNGGWHQMNNGSKVTVPSCKDATIVVNSYYSTADALTFAGSTEFEKAGESDGNYSATYTATTDDATVEIAAIKDNTYINNIVITLPVVSGEEPSEDVTLFSWIYDGSTTTMNSSLNATGGSVTLKTTDTNKSFSTESASYTSKIEGQEGSYPNNGLKIGANATYLEVTMTDGTFKAGDEISICGYNDIMFCTSADRNATIGDVATGTSKTDYQVGTFTIPETFTEQSTLYLFRKNSSSTGIAAIQAIRPGFDPSFVASPEITPATGTYGSEQEVTITCETEDAKIYYTTDGTDPTAESTAYTAAFTVTETTTVKAIAIKGENSSEIAESVITIVTIEPGTSNLEWDYTEKNIPDEKEETDPMYEDNGLFYASFVNDKVGENVQNKGMNGVKLNSGGKAWFAKNPVEGKLTLTIGNRKTADAYAVNVYACTINGETATKGDLIGAISVDASPGTNSLDIPAAVTGIYIERKTGAEGVLQKIVFKEKVARKFKDFEITNDQLKGTVADMNLPEGVTLTGTQPEAGNNSHGYIGATITVPTDGGAVKFTIGGCQYANSTFTVKNSESQTLATLSNHTEKCYHQDQSAVTYIYTGEATTLTFSSIQYLPYFKAEAVEVQEVTVTYKDQNGTVLGEKKVIEGDAIGESPYTEADLTIAANEKFRGWTYTSGVKVQAADAVTSNTTVLASVTPIEAEPTVGSVQTYDLTNSIFYPEDHENFDVTNGSYYNNHGFDFAAGGSFSVKVAGKAQIVLTLCEYGSGTTITVTDANSQTIASDVRAKAESGKDGDTETLNYDGEATTLTFTFATQTYLHKVTVYNVENFIEKDEASGWYIVPAGDGASLVLALNAAASEENSKIFLPNGTYDLGQATLTPISGTNVSLIGESMDGVIIKTKAPKEGLGTADLFLNTATGLYMQDLTLKNELAYSGNDGRAPVLEDKGTKTICKNVKMLSYQDTYYSHQVGGLYYFEDGEIHGTVDYLCGNGKAYFNGVKLVNEERSTATVTANSELYVFNNCVIENNASKYNLGRAWSDNPVCVWLNTTLMDPDRLIESRWNLTGINCDYSLAGEFGTKNSEGTDITPASNEVTFTKANTNMNTILSADQAATYTIGYVLGDWATTAQEEAKQVTAPTAELKDGTISWTAADGATAYAIFKDDVFQGITTGTSWVVDDNDAGAPRRASETTSYKIRAANSRGGFGLAAEVSPATGISAIETELGGDVKIYDLNGRRVMTPTKGVYIINGKKVVVK